MTNKYRNWFGMVCSFVDARIQRIQIHTRLLTSFHEYITHTAHWMANMLSNGFVRMFHLSTFTLIGFVWCRRRRAHTHTHAQNQNQTINWNPSLFFFCHSNGTFQMMRISQENLFGPIASETRMNFGVCDSIQWCWFDCIALFNRCRNAAVIQLYWHHSLRGSNHRNSFAIWLPHVSLHSIDCLDWYKQKNKKKIDDEDGVRVQPSLNHSVISSNK